MYLDERTSLVQFSKSRYDYTHTTHIRPYSIITILCGLKYIGMGWDVFWLVMYLNQLNTFQSTWFNGEMKKP